MNRKQVNIRFEVGLLGKLRIEARRSKRSLGDVVTAGLTEWLRRPWEQRNDVYSHYPAKLLGRPLKNAA